MHIYTHACICLYLHSPLDEDTGGLGIAILKWTGEKGQPSAEWPGDLFLPDPPPTQKVGTLASAQRAPRV